MNKKNAFTTSLIGLFTSILAFLGLIGCCGFPLIAVALAWFGIGASQLSFLASYQPLFTSIAVIALVYGFYVIYFKKTNKDSDCCNVKIEGDDEFPTCEIPTKKSNLLAKIMLWIGVIAVASTFFINGDSSQATEKQSCCPESSSSVEVQQIENTSDKNKNTSRENRRTEPKASCCPKK